MNRPTKTFSFEFFPPRTSEAEAKLDTTCQRLAALKPDFFSVTFGAGGSTREKTLDTVLSITRGTGVDAAPHISCIGFPVDNIRTILGDYQREGIRRIVALRGDMPVANAPYEPHPQGYENAAALVTGLRAIADFEISVAAYPEVHPEAPSAEFDIDNLRRKIDAGATRAITQFFFEPDCYLRFRDRCAAAGIDGPELFGMGVNLATGAWSRGGGGLWIEKGQLTHPVQELTVAGDLQGILTLEDIIETLMGLEIVDEEDEIADLRELAQQRWEAKARKIGFDPDEEESADP